MRCPKCGFNSFDHNLLCPKCRKDLTAARKLLNLSVPSPGAVDFFKTAASRTVFPEPFLAGEVEVFPEAVDAVEIETAESIEPLPAPPRETGAEDIEPIDEIEEIEPNEDEIEPEDEEIEPEDDEIEPDGEEEEEEEIEPARLAVSPAGDEEIEIELDEFEELEPEPPAGDPGAELTVAPSIAETALAQIKSSLTATGDLAAADDIEPEPAPAEEAAEPLEAEPEEFAAETPATESLAAAPEELEPAASPDLSEESGITDVTAIAEALPDETAIALDDDFLSDAIGKLPDLADDFDLEN